MTDTVEVEMESVATEEAIDDTSNKDEQDETGPHKPKSRICTLHCSIIFFLRKKKSTFKGSATLLHFPPEGQCAFILPLNCMYT